MTALLKERNNNFYCSKCMMRQNKLRHTCSFCGAEFSNYFTMLYKITKVLEDEKTMYDFYDDFDYDDFDYNDVFRMQQ